MKTMRSKLNDADAGDSRAPICLDDIRADVLTVEEAAPIFAMGARAVRQAAHRGQIPAIRVGGYIRIPKAALRRFFETGNVEVRLEAPRQSQ